MANGNSDGPPKDLRMLEDRSSKPDTRSIRQRLVDTGRSVARSMTEGRPSPPVPASRFKFTPPPTGKSRSSRTQSSPKRKSGRKSGARN